jgi:hypothetical protein
MTRRKEVKEEKSTGQSMHYPEYHISNKTLKLWATLAATKEEKRVYTSAMKYAHQRK